MLGTTLESKSTAAFSLTLQMLQFNLLELSFTLSIARAGSAFRHKTESSWVFKLVAYVFAKNGNGEEASERKTLLMLT